MKESKELSEEKETQSDSGKVQGQKARPATSINISGFDLVKTCSGCPEQYDVYLGVNQVGYLRLRHGYFRADVPSCGGKTVYQAHPSGDGYFMDWERAGYLNAAVAAIAAELQATSVPSAPKSDDASGVSKEETI